MSKGQGRRPIGAPAQEPRTQIHGSLTVQSRSANVGRYGCWYGCGPYHEDPCPYAVESDDRDDERFWCNTCTAFDISEREYLASCRQDPRCPLVPSPRGGRRG